MPTQTELAWTAGFFDGEGSITISPRGNTHYLKVGATQRDIRPLLKIQEWFGGSVGSPYGNGVRNYSVGNAAAGVFLETIRPYLVVKAEQADVALQFQSRRSRADGRRVMSPEEDAADRQRIFDIRAELGLQPKQNRR